MSKATVMTCFTDTFGYLCLTEQMYFGMPGLSALAPQPFTISQVFTGTQVRFVKLTCCCTCSPAPGGPCDGCAPARSSSVTCLLWSVAQALHQASTQRRGHSPAPQGSIVLVLLLYHHPTAPSLGSAPATQPHPIRAPRHL